MNAIAKPAWAEQREGRTFTRVGVTTMLNGAVLSVPMHVITGGELGPTFGIITNTHGDEFLPTVVIRRFLNELDIGQLKGRIVLISVANPWLRRGFGRQTPEQHGRTDLHEVYPGSVRGNMTQMIAATIVEQVMHHVDALIDFHSGGSGGRLQARVDYNSRAPDNVKAQNLALARAFGAPFVARERIRGSAAHYLNGRGIPAVNPEVGGAYLGPDTTRYYSEMILRGLAGVLRHLGHIEGSATPPRQLQFDARRGARFDPVKAATSSPISSGPNRSAR